MNIVSLIKKVCLPATLWMLLSMAGSQQAYAFNCSLSNVYGAINAVVPLQSSNLTIGPDVPAGTIIYQQYFKPNRKTVVNCTGNTTIYQPVIQWSYSNQPSPSGWSGNGFSRVYETGIPGIGIAIYTFKSPSFSVPFDYAAWQDEVTETTMGWVAQEGSIEFDIVLIKTGNISPGTLNGSQLPQLQYNFTAQNISPITMGTLRFTGTINIVSQTCQTPDVVNVPMGDYKVKDYFTGKGKTTEWKDATISLTDCPQFHGILSDGRNTWYTDNNNNGIGAITNNILTLKLSPNTTPVNSASGILGLTSGTDSATGVGIQMAYGSTSDNSHELVDFDVSKNYTMQSNATGSQSMPLVARYIQTDSTVTPGKANATVTFTINYY